MSKFCGSCGANAEKLKFCGSCGSAVGVANKQPVEFVYQPRQPVQQVTQTGKRNNLSRGRRIGIVFPLSIALLITLVFLWLDSSGENMSYQFPFWIFLGTFIFHAPYFINRFINRGKPQQGKINKGLIIVASAILINVVFWFASAPMSGTFTDGNSSISFFGHFYTATSLNGSFGTYSVNRGVITFNYDENIFFANSGRSFTGASVSSHDTRLDEFIFNRDLNLEVLIISGIRGGEDRILIKR